MNQTISILVPKTRKNYTVLATKHFTNPQFLQRNAIYSARDQKPNKNNTYFIEILAKHALTVQFNA